jgi:hypothetical protein
MNLKSLLRMPLVVLPFFYACAAGSGKPAATADDADSKAESSETAKSEDEDMGTSEKSEAKAEEGSDKKEEAKSDKKAAAKGDDDGGEEAAPKDDSRTTETCRKVIDDNRKAFKKCYKDKPDVKGTIVLQLELDAAGKIKKAYIDEESTISDKQVQDCILDFAKTLVYPKSTKGLDKNFEYTFGIRNG